MKNSIKIIIESLFDDIDNITTDTDISIADNIIRKSCIKKFNNVIKKHSLFKVEKLNIDEIHYLNSCNDILITPNSKDELGWLLRYVLEYDDTYNLNFIDVSKMTSLSYLFEQYNINLRIKDIDISEWDVSNVTDMSYMFKTQPEFNADLSKWDVSNVTNMDRMFSGCAKFTGKGLKNWNVSNVKSMRYMFAVCKSFKEDVTEWDVSNLKYCTEVFCNANYPLWNNIIDKWDLKNKVSEFKKFKRYRENNNLNI